MPKNAQTIAQCTHFTASKVILKIVQAKLQQDVNQELPDVQARFRKGRGNHQYHWITEKAREFPKNIYFCFLTWIQISQEAGKVGIPEYTHLFKNFKQFDVIHTVKCFQVVNEAEDVFLEFPCFFYDPTVFGNMISVTLHFLNLACTSGSSWFTYC